MAARLKSYLTDEEFRLIVAESLSVRQVLSRIGLVPAGGNYKTVHNRIARLELNTSHFTGAAWNVGTRYKNFGRSFRLATILVENSPYTSTNTIRTRLLKEKLKEHKCELCGLQEWLGNQIPLELHHQNGCNNDHRLDNLQLLCPNCHALTPSYRGKNQTRARVVKLVDTRVLNTLAE